MSRDYKREYNNYHASPQQKKNRAARNLWNRRMRGKVPAGKEIDHKRALMNGGTNVKANIRYRDISSNRADKSPVKTAMWHAFCEELDKLAGVANLEELKRMQEKVRPGDIVSFRQHAADKTNLKDLALTAGLSKPISALTGSPYSHTAMIDSIDPEKGIKLIENYEGSTNKGVGHRWLNDMADSTTFKFTRPAGYSAAEAQQAVDHARAAVGNSDYSKFDLLAMGAQEATGKVLGKDSKVGKAVGGVTALGSNAKNMAQNCDAATGVCSFLPVHAYGKVRGGTTEATKNLVGESFKHKGATNVTPAMLAEFGDHIGDVSPLARNKSVLEQAAWLGADAVEEKARATAGKARRVGKKALGRLRWLRNKAKGI